MPIFEGADEEGHFCSADYIAHKNKLPNLLINDGCFIWHPPLYYLYLSPFIRLFHTPQHTPFDVKENPKAFLLRKGQYAQYVHTKKEMTFRWNTLQLMVHVLRLLTSFFAVLIFIITWKAARNIFSEKLARNLSLLLFFNQMFIHIFTTLTNVTLVSLIATVVILIDLAHAKESKSLKVVFIQGLLIGFGYITKITILSLIPVWLILMIVEQHKFKYSLRLLIGKVSIFTIGFALSAGWYLARNLMLYGNILEVNALAKTYGASAHDLLLERVGLLNYLNSIALTLFKTFWSGYGYLTIRFPEFVNLPLLIVLLLIIYTIYVNYKKLNRELTIALIYAVGVIGGLVIMNFRLSAMHAKDLFPAYMPLALLFGYGLFHAKDTIKKGRLRFFTIVSLILGSYLFAQVEIVKLLKALFQFQWAPVVPLLLAIAIKTVLVFALVKIVVSFIGKAKFDPKSVVVLTYLIAIFDIFILFSSVYLLYKSFI